MLSLCWCRECNTTGCCEMHIWGTDINRTLLNLQVVFLLCKENIWLNCRILCHIHLCKQSYNRECRLEFAYLKLWRAKSCFCHGFADWEPCFISSKMCIWKVLSKSLHVFPSYNFAKRNNIIEYSRGETNLNSFIHSFCMFSSSIMACLHGTPGHISTQTIEITRNENPASNVESTK